MYHTGVRHRLVSFADRNGTENLVKHQRYLERPPVPLLKELPKRNLVFPTRAAAIRASRVFWGDTVLVRLSPRGNRLHVIKRSVAARVLRERRRRERRKLKR